MSAPRPKTIIKSVGHGTVMSTPGGNKTRTRFFAPTPVAVQGGSTTPRRWDASKNNGRIRPILASKISRRRRSKSFSNSQMSQLSSISPKRRIEVIIADRMSSSLNFFILEWANNFVPLASFGAGQLRRDWHCSFTFDCKAPSRGPLFSTASPHSIADSTEIEHFG